MDRKYVLRELGKNAILKTSHISSIVRSCTVTHIFGDKFSTLLWTGTIFGRATDFNK